jgi:hypothetical protein
MSKNHFFIHALFATIFCMSAESVRADPLLGKWLCKTHTAEDNFLDIQADQLTSVTLLDGARTFDRLPSDANTLLLKTDSILKLSVKLAQEKLRLNSAQPKLDLQCDRLSSQSYQKFVPLPQKEGGSLLDMAVIFRKDFLQNKDVKKNVQGQYVFESLRVSIVDFALPESRWTQDGDVPRLSTLYENTWMMWGADPLPTQNRNRRSFGSPAHPEVSAQLKKWLEAKNILVSDLQVTHCPPTSVANCDKYSRVMLFPLVIGLPMKQIGNYIFMDDFHSFNKEMEEMKAYFKDFELLAQGEFKLTTTAAVLVAQYEKKAVQATQQREQQTQMMARLTERVSQSPTDLVLATVVKQRGNEKFMPRDKSMTCTLPFSLSQRAQDALIFNPEFLKWSDRTRSPWIDTPTKNMDEMYAVTQRMACNKWMGPAAELKTLIEAARRDGFEINIDTIIDEPFLLDAFAQRLKLANYAELQAAEALKATPEQYLVLKQQGLDQPEALQRAWASDDVSQYLKVIDKTATDATVGDYMNYLRDLERGAKKTLSAAAYRKEELQRITREQQEARERERRREQARAKLTLNLSIPCYGQEHDAGRSLRTLMDMYASNTHIQAITQFIQSSAVCHISQERRGFPAKGFVEVYRSGQLVGIRSRESVAGVGYLYSFVNYKDWDRD